MNNQLLDDLGGIVIFADITLDNSDPASLFYQTYVVSIASATTKIVSRRRELSVKKAATILNQMVSGTYKGSYAVVKV